MQFFCDFEAVSSHIVAAAFVSADGSVEEHWLMKPFPSFRRLEGVYARLLPYNTEELLYAPLLQRSGPRFKRLIEQAENLWFYGLGDMRFFEDSFPRDDALIAAFCDRYIDAKQLVEEILTPVYVRNVENGRMVNLRNVVPYLEAEKINTIQEQVFYEEVAKQTKLFEQLHSKSVPRLKEILARAAAAVASSDQDEAVVEDALTINDISDVLRKIKQTLHPQTLLPREVTKDLRWLRTRLARLQFSSPISPRVITNYLRVVDAILTTQGKRFTSGKVTLESMQELILEQNLPLEIIELFAETKLDRTLCLEHIGKEIGLQNAATILLGEEAAALIEGDEHNALYDSRLLRVVMQECFERYEKLQPILTGN